MIQANIPDLYSELHFLNEFAVSSLVREEASYRLTETEQAVHYIETLGTNILTLCRFQKKKSFVLIFYSRLECV